MLTLAADVVDATGSLINEAHKSTHNTQLIVTDNIQAAMTLVTTSCSPC